MESYSLNIYHAVPTVADVRYLVVACMSASGHCNIAIERPGWALSGKGNLAICTLRASAFVGKTLQTGLSKMSQTKPFPT